MSDWRRAGTRPCGPSTRSGPSVSRATPMSGTPSSLDLPSTTIVLMNSDAEYDLPKSMSTPSSPGAIVHTGTLLGTYTPSCASGVTRYAAPSARVREPSASNRLPSYAIDAGTVPSSTSGVNVTGRISSSRYSISAIMLDLYCTAWGDRNSASPTFHVSSAADTATVPDDIHRAGSSTYVV